MKTVVLLVLTFVHLAMAAEPKTLTLNAQILNAPSRLFKPHTGPFTLAIDLPYAPLLALRESLQTELGIQLDYFKGWDPAGEAHITVITPPEFINILSKHLTEEEINGIARAQKIQEADVAVLGLGSGKPKGSKSNQETFFLILESRKARQVRLAIHAEYVRKGGSPQDWDPTWYFPHATVGYLIGDVHEHQGLLKNVKYSWDARFLLKL